MPRPIQALIHQDALRHNLGIVRQHAQGARLWAVVKADAYGHGIAHVYPALAHADGFALIDLAEAEQLRALGWTGPILLLEGAFCPEDVATCARLDLWHVVHCPAQIDMLAAATGSVRHHVFLKLNSGMNRLGFAPAAYGQAWARLRALAQVGEISLMTHFSDADGPLGITRQLATFEAATHGLPGARSVANSAATLRHGSVVHAQAVWVRAGVALYGGVPDFPEHASGYWNLQPAMSLRTRIIAVQTLQAGDTVGYGSRFVAGEPMTVGIAACGYADGYPRACASGTPVLVDGVPSRTVGRVSMDMLCVDLTPVRHAGRCGDYGSEVVLWGRASAAFGGAVQPVDAVAHAAGTIGYELMCAVARRVPIAVADASA